MTLTHLDLDRIDGLAGRLRQYADLLSRVPGMPGIGTTTAYGTMAEAADALSRRVPASGGELTRYAMETLTGGTIPLPVVRDYGEWVKFSDLAAAPIPEGKAEPVIPNDHDKAVAQLYGDEITERFAVPDCRIAICLIVEQAISHARRDALSTPVKP